MKVDTIRAKDLRKYSILPIRAVQDPEINRTAALAVLAVICSYTDELGRTFVSQARIASDLNISRPAVNRQVKRLMDLGYLVYARKQYKDQKTNTVKVIYDEEVKDDSEARSNLTAKQQMELAEREAGLSGVTPEVTGPRVTLEVTPETPGVTSEVTGCVTSKVTLNETYNDNKYILGESRKYCVLFLRKCEEVGAMRNYSERDEQVMAGWIRDGLTLDAWSSIIDNHISFCRTTVRDVARGIGYFRKPVADATAASMHPKASTLLKKAVASVRAV